MKKLIYLLIITALSFGMSSAQDTIGIQFPIQKLSIEDYKALGNQEFYTLVSSTAGSITITKQEYDEFRKNLSVTSSRDGSCSHYFSTKVQKGFGSCGTNEAFQEWLETAGYFKVVSPYGHTLLASYKTRLLDGCSSDDGFMEITVIITDATDDCQITSIDTFFVADLIPPYVADHSEDNLEGFTHDGGDGFEQAFANWKYKIQNETFVDGCNNIASVTISIDSDEIKRCEYYNGNVVVTATDDCGNFTTKITSITITGVCDNEVTIVAEDLTVQCLVFKSKQEREAWLAAGAYAIITAKPGEVFTVFENDYDGTTGQNESDVINFTSTGSLGTVVTFSATFTVTEDIYPPVVEGYTPEAGVIIPFDTVYIDCGEAFNQTMLIPYVYDNCGDPTLLDSGVTINGDTMIMYWIYFDNSDNITRAEQITIRKSCNSIVVENLHRQCLDYDTKVARDEWLENGAFAVITTACPNEEFTIFDNDYDGSTGSDESDVVNFTSTGSCGTLVSYSATFSVRDTVPPVIEGYSPSPGVIIPFETVYIDCGTEFNQGDLDLYFYDNCGESTRLKFDVTINGDTMTKTWIYFDNSDNVVEATQITIRQNCTGNLAISITDEGYDFISVIETECLDVQDLALFLAENAGIRAETDCDQDDFVTFVHDFVMSEEEAFGTCFNGQVIFTLSDACGNVATVTRTINLSDDRVPTITNTGLSTIEINCGEQLPALEFLVENACDYTLDTIFSTTLGNLTRTVVVTSRCGISDSFSQTVISTDNSAFDVEFELSDSECGDNLTSVQLNVFPVANYSYLWSTGSTDEFLANVEGGAYSVTVTSEAGCVRVFETTFTAPSELVIEVIENTQPQCFGSLSRIDVQGRGGNLDPNATYRYDWINESTGETVSTTHILQATIGTYVLNVSDGNGCNAQQTFEVIEPEQLTMDLVSVTPKICNSGTLGSIQVEATGGTGSYTYYLGMEASNSTGLFTGLEDGVYNLMVTDENVCNFILDNIVVECRTGCTVDLLSGTFSSDGVVLRIGEYTEPITVVVHEAASKRPVSLPNGGVVDTRSGEQMYSFNLPNSNLAYFLTIRDSKGRVILSKDGKKHTIYVAKVQ